MVYYPSCRTRDVWAEQLEKEFDAFLGKLPRDVDRARGLESLAEALDTVLRMECERLPPTPGRGIPGDHEGLREVRPSPAAFGQGEKAEYGVLPLIPLALAVAPVIAEKVAPVIAEKVAGVFKQQIDTGAEFSQIGALLRTVAPIIGKAVAKEVTPIIAQKVFGSVGPGASFQQFPGEKVFDSRVLLVLMTKDIPSLEEIAQEVPQDVRLTEREKDLLRRLIERQIEQVRSAPLEFGQVGQTGSSFGVLPLLAVAAPVLREVAPVVIREVAKRFGALAEFSAIFRGREAATNLARTYQSNGISSFVYFDPVAFTPAPVTEVRRVPIFDPETGELLEEMEARPVPVPEIDPETGQPRRGVWRVEIGIPTEAERELVRVGKIRVVPPGEKVPADPRRQIFLEFPPAPVTVMGAILERPTLLDALVDSEFGAILVAGAAAQAPCDCVSLPPEGKLLCTREGAIGSLSQVQVQRNCSEIRPAADGRLARAQALREGQAVCGALVEGIADIGERFATRFTCLQELLAGRGISS